MVVTDIRRNARNKDRVSVFLDGQFAFSCYIETMEEERLCKGVSLNGDDIARIGEADGAQYAWHCATRYLSRGLKTEKQVRDNLKSHEVDPCLIEPTMEKLRSYRLVDDAEYARLCADQLYERYGRFGVVRKLREKGIDQAIIDEVAVSPGDWDVLCSQVERLAHRYRNDEPAKRTQKILRALGARGFDFDDIRRALRKFDGRQLAGELTDE